MASQTETRKYLFFPKSQSMASQGKGPEPEQSFTMAMGHNGNKADKPCTGSLRSRMREHNLSRRRKVSVTELAHMTTVYERIMDSRKCGQLTAACAYKD